MCDEWMTGLELDLTREQFDRLPRHPAFRYERIQGRAYISPRPRHYHALLGLAPWPDPPPGGPRPRPLRPADWDALPGLFAASFAGVQPFAGLDDKRLRQAAESCLRRTREGGDGPWNQAASFVIHDDDRPAGAILVTQLPSADPSSWDAYSWTTPPPPECIRHGLGRPHLTWVFVGPGRCRAGLGTILLAASVRVLAAQGYRELLSTFLIGNAPTMLWHWRNGFRLLPYPGAFHDPPPRPT